MNAHSINVMPDRALIAATLAAATNERHATAELLALLGELDTRRLYLGEGCSSLFTYCTRVLHFSEHARRARVAQAAAPSARARLLSTQAARE